MFETTTESKNKQTSHKEKLLHLLRFATSSCQLTSQKNAGNRALCIRMKLRSFRNSLEDVSDMFRNLKNKIFSYAASLEVHVWQENVGPRSLPLKTLSIGP